MRPKLHVTIQFWERFREPLLAGVKVCTARTRPMARVGDTFDAFGARFEVIETTQVCLRDVCELYKDEGCQSREEFVEVWKGIHPRAGYREDQVVWLHRFKKIGSASDPLTNERAT